MSSSVHPCPNAARIFALTEPRSLPHSWIAVTNTDFIGQADDSDRWGAIPSNALYPNRLAAGVVAWPALPHPHGPSQARAESDENDSNHLVSKLEATLGVAATTEQKQLLEMLRRNLADTQETQMIQSNQRASYEGPLEFKRTYGAGIA